ncbi:hypothetical protein [Kineosporia sp. R_H_3]|uniref:hypothetical protein n=1 Tax=Kineosporia sp. R_H_3 TaxID=1961848 RepID=UPI00117A8CFE|nr:hypothetical protein [Kineosporia sp. R_H_3]
MNNPYDSLFVPRDSDYEDFLGRAEDAEIDAFAAEVTGEAKIMGTGVQQYPRAFRRLGQIRPVLVSEGLQILISDALANPRAAGHYVITTWRRYNPDPLPAALQMAAAVADGLEHAEVQVKSGMIAGRVPPQLSNTCASMISNFRAMQLARGHGALQAACRKRLRALIESNPEDWLLLVPWALQLSTDERTLVETITWAHGQEVDATPALLATEHAAINPAADRATQLLDTLRGRDSDDALLNAIARNYDRSLLDAFPRPLASPTSTWMSSLDVEARLRGALNVARSEWAQDFPAQARSEEEGHLGSLITHIKLALRQAATTTELETGATPVDVRCDYRRIPKSEEATVYADLAIVVDIDILGELRTKVADLVQVKKTLYNGATTAPPPNDRWKIDLLQLHGLLAKSPTSAYWLMCHDGTVLVVPAKLLDAIRQARAASDQKTIIVNYTQVRHAAVGLDTYFIDLCIGTWLGSSGVDLVELARGDGTSTVASGLLEVAVRSLRG